MKKFKIKIIINNKQKRLYHKQKQKINNLQKMNNKYNKIYKIQDNNKKNNLEGEKLVYQKILK